MNATTAGRGKRNRPGRRARPSPVLLPLVGVLAMVVAARADGPGHVRRTGELDQRALRRLHSPPLGLPTVPLPEENAATVEKIRLGRKLFFDRRLSANGTMSCGMCHIPEQGFTSQEMAKAVGLAGQSLRRNSPTIFNVAYVETPFHDGRETSLETQAIGPLLASDEMANPSLGWLVAKVRGLPDYARPFRDAFGGPASGDRIGMAIASWERTVLSANSAFDRWRYGGQVEALGSAGQRGYELFAGEARCSKCHEIGEAWALFTDGAFHDTGIAYRSERLAAAEETPVEVEIAPGVLVPVKRDLLRTVGDPEPADLGRLEVTGRAQDRWRYRTPGLRNVALTAPYMHDGSLRTLREVVDYYNRGGEHHENLDPLLRPLELGDEDLSALVTFLESLTGDNVAELVADARSVEVGN